jgi:hypothetical protein
MPVSLEDAVRTLSAHTPRSGGSLQLVFLNGGNTEPLGRALFEAGVLNVISWRTRTNEEAARTFCEGFYKILHTLPFQFDSAFEAAKLAITDPLKATMVGSQQFGIRDPDEENFSQIPAAGIPVLLNSRKESTSLTTLPTPTMHLSLVFGGEARDLTKDAIIAKVAAVHQLEAGNVNLESNSQQTRMRMSLSNASVNLAFDDQGVVRILTESQALSSSFDMDHSASSLSARVWEALQTPAAAISSHVQFHWMGESLYDDAETFTCACVQLPWECAMLFYLLAKAQNHSLLGRGVLLLKLEDLPTVGVASSLAAKAGESKAVDSLGYHLARQRHTTDGIEAKIAARRAATAAASAAVSVGHMTSAYTPAAYESPSRLDGAEWSAAAGDSEPSTYRAHLAEKPFGFKLRPAPEGMQHLAVVESSNPLVFVGSFLLSMNGVDFTGLSYKKALSKLRSAPVPSVIEFSFPSSPTSSSTQHRRVTWGGDTKGFCGDTDDAKDANDANDANDSTTNTSMVPSVAVFGLDNTTRSRSHRSPPSLISAPQDEAMSPFCAPGSSSPCEPFSSSPSVVMPASSVSAAAPVPQAPQSYPFGSDPCPPNELLFSPPTSGLHPRRTTSTPGPRLVDAEAAYTGPYYEGNYSSVFESTPASASFTPEGVGASIGASTRTYKGFQNTIRVGFAQRPIGIGLTFYDSFAIVTASSIAEIVIGSILLEVNSVPVHQFVLQNSTSSGSASPATAGARVLARLGADEESVSEAGAVVEMLRSLPVPFKATFGFPTFHELLRTPLDLEKSVPALAVFHTNMQFGLEVVAIDSEWVKSLISSRLLTHTGELVIGLYLSEDHRELVFAAKSNRSVASADAFLSLGSKDVVSLHGGAVEGIYPGAGERDIGVRFTDGDMTVTTPNTPIRDMTCAFLATFVRQQQLVQQDRGERLEDHLQQRSISLEDDSKCVIS